MDFRNALSAVVPCEQKCFHQAPESSFSDIWVEDKVWGGGGLFQVDEPAMAKAWWPYVLIDWYCILRVYTWL